MPSAALPSLISTWYTVTYHLPPVTCHPPPVTCHLSPVTCNLSSVSCLLSSITCPQITFFLGWLVVDQRRQEGRRDCCCCCLPHAALGCCGAPPAAMPAWLTLAYWFGKLGKLLAHVWTKLAVLLLAASLLATAIYGATQLQPHSFDPSEFRSRSSVEER